MKKWMLVAALLLFAGCGGDNFSIEPVIEGQTAPLSGWNLGPSMYVQEGDEVKLTGVVIWIDGLDPNDIVDQL